MTRTILLLLVLFGALFTACSNEGPGEVDAPTADVPSDANLFGDGGGSCSSPDGYTTCTGGNGVTCCGGVESRFNDGPCYPIPDAGVIGDAGSPCDTDPTAAGCPCTTEGEIACRMYRWRHECEGGVWTVAVGYVCC